MTEKIKKMIDKKKVISFDLFDTLITRNLDKPTDLFKIVQKMIDEREIGLPDFVGKRIFSEKTLIKNRNEKREITLQDIYDFMGTQFNINHNMLKSIQDIEISIEEKICETNRSVGGIYNYALKSGKTIIITTDMYLPQIVIEKILKKNAIKCYKIYVSCDINARKSNGSLFEYILKDLQIDSSELLHIGDNKRSDYYMPKIKGIESILIKNQMNNSIIDRNDKSMPYRFLLYFINNHINIDCNYFYKLGYQTLGPLLYGYSVWLRKKICENEYDKIFFLSRDGFIMQSAFHILDPNIESNYMYASRQALITPTLWMYDSLSEVIRSSYFSHHMTMSVFLSKIGLESHKYKDVVEEFGYTLEQYIDIYIEQNSKTFNSLWTRIYGDVRANSKIEFDNMVLYFKNIGFYGKVAIVDIGWFGHMQLAIERVLKVANINATVDGYYVGVYPESTLPKEIKMYGYIFEKNKNERMRYQKRYFNSIFELSFTAKHGSVKRYINSSPDFFDYEYEGTDTAKKIQLIQDGALKFVKDYVDYDFEKYMELNEMVFMKNYLKFGNSPTNEDINQFSQFEFFDDEIKIVIPKYSGWYYILHPNCFIQELKYSLWVTGLLKKILHINIDYYKVANVIRRLYYGREC